MVEVDEDSTPECCSDDEFMGTEVGDTDLKKSVRYQVHSITNLPRSFKQVIVATL